MWRKDTSSKYYKRANVQIKRFERALLQEAPDPNQNIQPASFHQASFLQPCYDQHSTYVSVLDLQSEDSLPHLNISETDTDNPRDNLCCVSQGGESSDELHDTATSNVTVSPSTVTTSNESFGLGFGLQSPQATRIQETTINTNLTRWALQHNISHVAVNDLLKILSPYHPTLPVDSRSLLHTPRNIIDIKVVFPGQYYHFGVKKGICKLLSKVSLQKPFINKTIKLLVNIDGLSISDSSSSQLYPILISIFGYNPVDVVGVYHGFEKPKDANEFLKDFVSEIITIMTDGIIFKDIKYSVKIKAFVCDVPAKSFIKYTKGHTGYFSCSKCLIEGEYVNNNVCFPDINFLLRTDEHFRNKIQEEHHTGTSILESIPGLDMIKSFALDPMHLLYLGVMKRLLENLWVNGKPPNKLSLRQINSISEFLLMQKANIPFEFSRKPRSLNKCKRWKATECSQFLFYTGPVCLKDVLSTDQYVHFLSLHAALTMLSTADLSKIDYAEQLLNWFVESFSNLYSVEHMSHNIHNLLHLVDEVRIFGPLYVFSAFKFENFMRTFKKPLRKNEKPLQQIIRRKEEIDNFESQPSLSENISYPVFKKRHVGGIILNQGYLENDQFSEVLFQDFKLSIMAPDNCCSVKDGSVVIIKNFIKIGSDLFIVGTEYQSKQNFYMKPCESSLISIYVVEQESDLKMWNINEIAFKYVKLSYQNTYVVFPLLHTIEHTIC